MSHFSVAVLHYEDQDVAELLAPFDENTKVEPYFWLTKEEAIQYAREHYALCENRIDEECYAYISDGHTTDSDGNIYRTDNPDSQWDWYAIGGRWSGLLRLKNSNDTCDSAKISDIDFSLDTQKYNEYLRWWEVVVDKMPLRDEECKEHFYAFYKEEYYKERYQTKEYYAKEFSQFSTWAVITPDGEWHDPGKMGWFGCSAATYEEEREFFSHYKERFIDSADPNLMITIVDCHI